MAKKRIRLHIALPVFFALMVIVTGLILTLTFYFSSLKSFNEISKSYISQTGKIASEKIENYLLPVSKISKINGLIVKFFLEKQASDENFIKLALTQFELYPQIVQIYFGYPNGNFIMLTREQNNVFKLEKIDRVSEPGKVKTVFTRITKDFKIIDEKTDYSISYDPRVRGWYKKATSTRETIWDDVYRFFLTRKLGITVATPVYNKDKLYGVVGIDINLDTLSSFLKNLLITKNTKVFIIGNIDKIIAAQGFECNYLTEIKSIKDREVIKAFNIFLKDKKNKFDFLINGKKLLSYFVDLHEKFGLKWTLGIVIPEDDFIGGIKRNLYGVLGLALLMIVLMIIVAIYLSKKITNPLNILTEHANQIKEFKLDKPIEVDTVFIEIENMSNAFERMVAGLKSFAKYVPTELVRKLIKHGKEAKFDKIEKEAAVLFCDIEKFTTISENVSPDLLIDQLNEFFTLASSIVEKHDGTVDKFIGDAIMAFWNAPEDIDDFIYKSCLAAIELQKEADKLNEKWRQEGKHEFKVRVGLNAGKVIVGNIGSATRLNYTIIGDAVNVAARLESLCKTYKTKILVSESIYNKVKNRLKVKKIDDLAVRGKTEISSVYELII